ncbi:uncharacterized protein PAC_02767 [Phialocephala subalpina]|uniref:Chromo domain-containing protein n=1 Tax=Phialocephala subalpina TaxID=576137 RepID=A0A1L7WJG3_9HELO|nr:uncharacterized protein PAC_02767 [Phialocephala subalpina]
MAPLRVIPYNYVPTKRRPRNNDQRSSVDKHPSTHHITQESKLDVLPEKVLQSLIAESPSDACGVGEKSRHDNVHEAIADEPARQGIQDPASIPNAEVSLSGVVADQDTLGGETDYGQVEFTDNGIVDIDLSSDFDFDFHSIFGDIDTLFEEQEVSPVIECNNGHATNPHTDASAGQTDSLVSEKEFAKSDTLGSGSPQLMKRRTNTKRRRGEGDSSVIIDGSSSGEGGTSDESNDESIFEGRRSKRSESGSRYSSPDSSICYSDIDQGVTKLATRLNSHHPLPVVDFTERRKDSTSTEPDGTSDSVQNIDPQMDDSNPASDDGDDELCRSPSWYRFGASATTTESTENARDYARPCYVAQVEDVYREREFHNIIGKEYIDGEIHYLVDWVPTLVRGHVLRKAQAQPLISRFEARCQAQKEKQKRKGSDRPKGFEAADGARQRRQRGRPRKLV